MKDRTLEPDTQVVQEIFADACDLPREQRETILNNRCRDDARLRQAVADLLAAADRAGRFMSDPQAAVERIGMGVPAKPAIPSQIGEFKIIRLLGEGGFGTVYLAAQEQPVRREVALKVIKLGMDTQHVIARFEAERQALAMMDHPNIAKVFDAGTTEAGRPYFVMELVSGVPITQYCDAHRLTIWQRLELFIPVCLAVGHAHQKGIIHRDIKPSNVLVAAHDRNPVPKVIDFGVAKATGASLVEQTGLTAMRPIPGTLEYMSPEQADMADRDVDTRSDIYSLGVLLYELLAGKTPFDGRKLRDLGYSQAQWALREIEPPRPSARGSGRAEMAEVLARCRSTQPRRLYSMLKGDLDWIAMRCLEKDKARRYQTAATLAQDIGHYLGHKPVTARPATAAYRTRKFIRRHKAGVVVIAALAAGLLVAIVGTTTGMLRARASQQRAEQSARQADLEAARANSVSDFMRGVFALAQPESGAAGEEARIDDVLKRTAAEIEARLNGRPEEQVMASRMLAEACRRLTLHDLAAGQLQRAYDLSRSLPGQEHSERTLDLATELVLQRYVCGKGEETCDFGRATLEDARKSLGQSNPITWKATNACALALSEIGQQDQTFALLSRLVEQLRSEPRAQNASHLARYQANLAVALRDRGDNAGATAAIRAAAQILKIDRLDPAMLDPARKSQLPALSTDELSAWMRGALDRDMDLAYSNAWLNRQILESGDFPEAVNFLERYVAAALMFHPGGTPTLSDRIADIAMLKLEKGDPAGASTAFARAIELNRSLRGHYVLMDQERWRIWTLCSATALHQGWRSQTLRDHVWCALNDLLRDNPPQRLIPRETRVQDLRFKLFRWVQNLQGESAEPVAEGTLSDLRQVEEPEAGIYLLGLEVPRLGDPPLRRSAWLVVSPWSIELRPIPRFDVARSLPSDHNLEKLFAPSAPVTKSTANSLAIDAALALATRQSARLNWFTLRAFTRLTLARGIYRLSASADDGVRVWVDGQLAIDAWYPQTSTTKDVVLELEAGEHEFKVEYFQQVGGYSLWLQLGPSYGPAKQAMLEAGGGVPQLDSQISLLSQQLSEHPADQSLQALHARALARRGRFMRAAAELDDVTRLDPANYQQAQLHGALLAYLQEETQYARLCRGIFERFAADSQSGDRPAIIKICSLANELPIDGASFQVQTDHIKQAPSTRLLLGIANYRLGHFEQASGQLREHLAASIDQPTERATAEIFLAMSLRRSGHNDEAQAWFNSAKHLVSEAIPIPEIEDLDAVGLENWLTCQVAWRQARALFSH